MYMLYDYLSKRLLPVAFLLGIVTIATAQEKETRSYKIFQFPTNKIPAINQSKTDWENPATGTRQLVDDNHHTPTPNPKNSEVKAKGLYKAYLFLKK